MFSRRLFRLPLSHSSTLQPKTVPRPKRILRDLAHDRSGSVIVIFALSTMVIFAAVGGAIDFARWHSAENQVANALDSAVLASVRVLQLKGSANETAALYAAKKYFDAHKPDWIEDSATTFRVTNSGSAVEGTTRTALSTPFLSVIGIQSLDISTKAAAVLANNTKTEISMMLDVTGSMGDSGHMRALRESAADLVNIVLWGNAGQSSTRVALVPFSTSVNVGSYASDLTFLPEEHQDGRKLVACVVDREGTWATSDTAPSKTSNNGFGKYGKVVEDHDPHLKDNQLVLDDSYRTSKIAAFFCTQKKSSYQLNPQVRIQPLTSDKSKLLSSIGLLTNGGYTAGALGTSMTWYTLSPNFGDIWEKLESGSRPGDYSLTKSKDADTEPELRKIAILMTDGEYNTMDGVQDEGDAHVTKVSDRAKDICQNMKDKGIKIYTVFFKTKEAPDVAINTMKDCASSEVNDPADSPSYFYRADNAGQLRNAFRDIAIKISSVRLKS